MRKKILYTALALFPLSMNAQTINDTTVAIKCQGTVIEWRGKTYNQTGVYYDTVFANIVFNEVFNYTGANQTYTVLPGVAELFVSLKGAGGGTGSNDYSFSNGGNGAFVSGILNVIAGATVDIIVGEGGETGIYHLGQTHSNSFGGGTAGTYINNGNYGGTGGGKSAIEIGGQELVVAGGGGGAYFKTADSMMNDGHDGGTGTGANGGGEGGGVNSGGQGGTSFVTDPSFNIISNIIGGANNGGIATSANIASAGDKGGNGEVIISSFDLVYVLDLTIVEIDTTIHVLNNVLTSNQADASYQWINCENGSNAPINGATSQSYTPTESGSYAVEITYNNCVDTSSCKVVNIVGLNEEVQHSAIAVFPNPTADVVNFSELVNVQIATVTGQIVMNKENVSLVDLSNHASGVYFITFTNNKGQVIQRNKIVKQ